MPACRQGQAGSGALRTGWRLAGGGHWGWDLTLSSTQIYPSSVPEEQLRLITSLVYLYSHAEINQWSITSRDTVMALLASDVALENQTEVRAVEVG